MENKKVYARYYKQLGRYDVCSSKKSWCVQLLTSNGNVSELFDEEDEPDIDDFLPSEVLEIIEERFNSYLYKSSRDETKKRISEIKTNMKEFDVYWLNNQLELANKRANQIAKRISEISEE